MSPSVVIKYPVDTLSRFVSSISHSNDGFPDFILQIPIPAKTGSPSSQLIDWELYENSSSITHINSTPEIKTFKNKDRIKLLNESKLES